MKYDPGQLVMIRSFNELISGVIEAFAQTTGREINLERAEAVHIRGDRDRLSQVISNLIGYAIKYST